MTRQGRFLTGSTMGHVVRMTATGALGITFVFLVDAANLLWISQLGDPALVAAIGFAFAIQFFSVSAGVGFMIAATAMISQSIGRGERDFARSQAGATLVISAFFQGLIAFLIIIFRVPLVEMAGASGETALLAERYLLYSMPSLVMMVIALVCSGVLRADGFGAKAMYITLLSGAVLMVVDPILIVWLDLRLDGASAGVSIFRFAMMLLGLYFAGIQNRLIALPNSERLFATLRPYLFVSGPVIATQMATPAGNYFLTMVMAPFGDDAVGAWAVVGRLTVVVFGGIFSLSGAIGGIFGQNFGAGQWSRVRATYRDALVFCVCYTFAAWGIVLAAIPFVITAFNLNPQGQQVLWAFGHFGVGSFVFVGALFVSNAAFNALERPLNATLVNWLKDGALSWPLAIAFATYFGAAGVIYGQALGSCLAGLAAAYWGWRFVSGLGPTETQTLDAAPPRAYPKPDRYRSR